MLSNLFFGLSEPNVAATVQTVHNYYVDPPFPAL